MSVSTTQQVFSTSGSTTNFIQALPATNSIRNSGGQVVIAGPVIIKHIYPITLSGSIASNSGVRLTVIAGNSGAVLITSGDVLYFADLTGQSGLGTGGVTVAPPPAYDVNFYAPSGVTTINSGTVSYALVVTYQTPR